MGEMSRRGVGGGVAFNKVAESFWAGIKLGWERGITQSKRVDRAIRKVAIEDHIIEDISHATRKLRNLKNENYIKM